MEAGKDTEPLAAPATGGAAYLEQARANSAEAGNVRAAQALPEPCPTCATTAFASSAESPYVYVIGEIDWRFPNTSLEKEFQQVRADTPVARLNQYEIEKKILKDNRYLARQVCWVMRSQTVETYILLPRDPADYARFADGLRPNTREDYDLVIGVLGGAAPPSISGGLSVNIVWVDQVYSFDRNMLLEGLSKLEEAKTEGFAQSSKELFDQIQQMADNQGNQDKHRAGNYLAVRSKDIYLKAYELWKKDYRVYEITGVPSRLNGTSGRKIIDVIFDFEHGTLARRKFFVRVDVTGEYPFIVTPAQDYFER
jgi:hypothetical protein